MKTRYWLVVGLMLLLVSGCASEKTQGYDGKVLKDTKGNIYILEHRLGDLYFVDTLDVEQHKSLSEFIKN